MGAQVQKFVASGDHERAIRLIETAKQNTLSAMIKLFASLRDLASEIQRDIAVVLTTSGRTFAVSTDAAVSVEQLSPGRDTCHVLFCRNVMMYFDRKTQADLVNRLASCLEPGGYLFVGHSESLDGMEHPLAYCRPAIYRNGQPRKGERMP